ncbi:hypothetical protein V6N13_025634 [Hibiscus sabdariffa]|uniref:Uncharacterized protein n=1 Tax=Hibiscus sabdariffa TaxID=183260 RepID=A0ABR2C9M2_9ROSI
MRLESGVTGDWELLMGVDLVKVTFSAVMRGWRWNSGLESDNNGDGGSGMRELVKVWRHIGSGVKLMAGGSWAEDSVVGGELVQDWNNGELVWQ